MKLLKEGIRVLEASDKKTIPSRFNDHRLGGKYRGCREIHLGGRSSDWLVVYKIDQGMVVLLATGKHDEIF
jgi:mRNA interferase YafQ